MVTSKEAHYICPFCLLAKLVKAWIELHSIILMARITLGMRNLKGKATQLPRSLATDRVFLSFSCLQRILVTLSRRQDVSDVNIFSSTNSDMTFRTSLSFKALATTRRSECQFCYGKFGKLGVVGGGGYIIMSSV